MVPRIFRNALCAAAKTSASSRMRRAGEHVQLRLAAVVCTECESHWSRRVPSLFGVMGDSNPVKDSSNYN